MRALVLICLAAAVAHADDRDEARREFTAGQAADRARDYQAALDHYLRANDLVPHPNAMFNIARDYERIGRRREAAVWYQRYLDAAAHPADRAQVERTIAALAATPATLTVQTRPGGARVVIDGRPRGAAPYSEVLPAGSHVVVVDDGTRRTTREITIGYGEPVALDLDLAAPGDGPPGTAGAPPGAAPRLSLGELPTEPPKRKRVGYLVGVGGGADLRGAGAIGLLDIGYALWTFDFGLRFGRAAGLSAIDVVARWGVVDAPLSPYFGLGYTIMVDNDPDADAGPTSARGFTVIAGVKYDVLRGNRVTTSLILESGVRGNGEIAPYVVPLIASVQVSGFYTSR